MGIEYKTDCPIRAVLKVLGGKWPLLVLSKLEESKRFSAIKREIPEISEKMLIETLKQLTENKLVTRKDFKSIPPHVEYRITDKGMKAMEAIPLMREALRS
ncbi:helix-turn-helix transcriptional regulator [Acidimicrobiia bacterium]|nr:helix-turn-helix transcriptional regulator [Acidimicrobiia bacterium]